jgi:hypothetical protein
LMQSMGSTAMLSALAGEAAQAQPPARNTRFYRLQYLYMRQGDQGNRVNQFLSSQMPLLTKNIQAVGVFASFLGPHMPYTLVLNGFTGLEEMAAADERIRKDSGYQAALEEMEKGAEPPYDSAQQILLRAAEFSPEITPLAQKPKAPRLFELRVYHAPTERQLRYVRERFSGAEIAIFHRSGVHPILYTETLVGPDMPNLTYIIPFASLADREKAWDAFGADPEWVKVRAESIAKGGQIVNQTNISLLKPAPFSPIQ